jgi:hypothetical protein
MTEPRRRDPAAAGAMLLATIVSCAGAGFGIGALTGFPVPLGLAGVFVGLIAGFALVHARFRRV